MQINFKEFLARYASGLRSTRHIEARLRFPRMDFYEALTRVTYKKIFGVWPDLENPRTLSEKMCWLKINDKRPENTVITDKYRMRGYAESLGLGHLLNQLLGVWDSAAEIDFNSLPDAYALKISNGSAMNVIKAPAAPLDQAATRRQLDRWQSINMADHKGEWYYAHSPSRIIAERYLDNGGGDLWDYKLFVFNGETRFIQYCESRYSGIRSLFLSPEWEPMPFTYDRFAPFDPPPPKPDQLDEMLESARILSQGFALVRVDYYIHDNRLLLGEMSLNPVGGYTPFTPEEWHLKIGDWLELPDKAAIAA